MTRKLKQEESHQKEGQTPELTALARLNDSGAAEGIAVDDEAHVARNLILGQFLCPTPRHGSCAIAEQDAVPSVRVGVGHGAKDALIRVDASKEQRLFARCSQIGMQRFPLRPQAAHSCLVEEEVAGLGDSFEGRVEVGVPSALEQASSLAVR